MFVNRKLLAAIGLAAVAVATSATTFLSPAQAASSSAGTATVLYGDVVRFEAGAHASNALTITVSGRTVTLDDRVALKAGKGCVAVKGDKTKVRCTTSTKIARVVAVVGDGNDTVTNRSAVPLWAYGGEGDDTLRGGSGADFLGGDGGADKLYGGKGSDDLSGDSGNDSIWGQDGNDYIDGGIGNDYVSAGTGNDNVVGGKGVDRLYGEDGLDKLYGGDDNDYINGGNRSDLIYGGRGEDRLLGGAGDDRIVGDASATSSSGTPYALSGDIITGGTGNDVIVAGAGDDTIDGSAGDDTIYSEYLKAGTTYAPIGRAASKDRVQGGTQTKQDSAMVLAGATVSGCEKVWKAGGPNPTISNTVRGQLNSLF